MKNNTASLPSSYTCSEFEILRRNGTRADSSSNGPESSRHCSTAVRVCPSVDVPRLAVVSWTYRWTTRARSRWTLLYWTRWPRPMCVLSWLSTQLEAGRQTSAGTSTSLSRLSTHPCSSCWKHRRSIL